ncbi:MAG: hypothetical protein AAF687_06305 [Pseudomonadota bacterium]
MNNELSDLEAFGAKWLPVIEPGARVMFEYAKLESLSGIHTSIADGFVERLGLKPIGFNWELLDANADASEPRCALGEMTQALAHDISNPSRDWLSRQTAQEAAQEFLEAFDPATRTLVSNRYDGLWNPIAGAAIEWGFVGYDDEQIALLLLIARE